MGEVHEVLKAALERLSMVESVPSLRRAAQESRETLDEARERLAAALPPEGVPLDVVVAGSYARQEASGESDFDYLVIAYELLPAPALRSTRQLLRAADEFVGQLGGGDADRRPGASGLFGHIVSAPDLTERIGLEQDTNLSHTRRLLILQESVSVYRPDLHQTLLRAMLQRYLSDYEGVTKSGPPRFLLNDCLRYWYTLTVDYQAKRWERDDRQWGLRYLKLLTSRKLSLAGTLASLLRCDEGRPATTEYLLAEFAKPPLARLAQLALDDEFNQHEALRTALEIAESFSAFLAVAEHRETVKALASLEDARQNELWRDRDEQAKQLHEALLLVFHNSYLAQRSRKYLAF